MLLPKPGGVHKLKILVLGTGCDNHPSFGMSISITRRSGSIMTHFLQFSMSKILCKEHSFSALYQNLHEVNGKMTLNIRGEKLRDLPLPNRWNGNCYYSFYIFIHWVSGEQLTTRWPIIDHRYANQDCVCMNSLFRTISVNSPPFDRDLNKKKPPKTVLP